MLSSFWEGFLQYLGKDKEKAPVLLSVLRQVKPIEITESEIIIGCDNQGVKFFLEKRTLEIEQNLLIFTKKKLKVRFLITEKKSKKEPPPLLNFQPSVEDIFLKSGLHLKYSFENFAVSSTNQVAYAAAQAVSQNLGSAYNPLFLYGGVGVGKTHLAQSVARKILEANQNKKVLFCPGDRFTNELIESIREKSTPRFRKRYRYLNLLIVDDIQFIAGKQTVQEEFFHTFNSIASSGGQIILTSDRPPSDIKNLEDRLRSRFSGGLTVDIQPPDFELRTAIVLIKAKEKKIEIDIEAAKLIAEQVADSRELEGALLSLYAKILGSKEQIDLETVASFFTQKENIKVKKISAPDVVRAVCFFYNIKPSHLKGETRASSVVLPRQVTMYLLRKELRLKFDEVAYILKRKDHTTVMHAVEKITRLLIKDPSLKQEVVGITKSLFSST
ncbi:MAG: Chromosomal replication initiator protein DnaA [Candidatus Roizmanbacteria bacterium GW2011_GWA2_36_23]|uniref:Chromosomal replication initiator protein DnaA n=1 Tax=Candidatus Roizmanbacteria bacterium GW2011_GWA2_36_23 TaxID=1618480 RepID=A0A0G0E3N2_9BACT|nr:MAG: Chromosomal replication initiator protein DnaA [Candidatus Roizmanbacteria bacterium GW2011_GWA2_36_23]